MITDGDLIAVTGDHHLLERWRSLGVSAYETNATSLWNGDAPTTTFAGS
jgi:hypothetical protein